MDHPMRYFIFCLLFLSSCSVSGPSQSPTAGPTIKSDGTYTGKLPLQKIRLQPGFHIGVYAEDVENARSLCYSPNGTLFVSTRDKGNVYALRDTNGDFVADERYTLATGLNMPNGVAFRNGSLYIAEISRITRLDNIEKNLAHPPTPVVVYDQYPTEEHHGWKYIRFGPDGKLYVPVGAPCNVCIPEKPIYASMTRIDVDHPSQPEIVQSGIRNSVGFDWHPVTKELWFTDNGRDWLGDDSPSCELNHAAKDGLNFGFPYCHQGDTPDPKFADAQHPCSDFVPPVQRMGPHVAPLGMEFYTGKMFPQSYHHQIFVAEHGSWNRTKKNGYQLSVVRIDEKGNSLGKETFAAGWLEADENVWGRPVDVEQLPDGSILVSDDQANAIYRIYYTGK